MATDSDSRIIANILDIIASKKPMSLLQQIAAEDVVCHMDQLKLNIGRSGLGTWFCYLHAMMRQRKVSIEITIDKIQLVEPGRYNVKGTALLTHHNGRIETRRFSASYLIDNGQIKRIWSTKSNYVGILGKSIGLPLYVGFIYHCLRAWYYNSRVRTVSRSHARSA